MIVGLACVSIIYSDMIMQTKEFIMGLAVRLSEPTSAPPHKFPRVFHLDSSALHSIGNRAGSCQLAKWTEGVLCVERLFVN